IDLDLLLIKAVDEIRGVRTDRDVLLDTERGVGKIVRKRPTRRCRQHRERLSGEIDLRGFRASICEPVRARKFAVEIVEAVILEVDDDEVLQRTRRGTTPRGSGRQAGAERDQKSYGTPFCGEV